MRELAGRTAVVTGAAGAIGQALATACGRAGMNVVLADLDTTGLARVAAALARNGVPVSSVATDVADEDSVRQLAVAATAAFGAVHLLCNNAGVTAAGRAWELPAATWDHVLDVNLRGVLHGIRVFVPLLLAQDEGHILNTASMAGLLAGPGFGAYVVSKHGVTALSECLYRELVAAGSRVGVSVLCPGFVAGGMSVPRTADTADPAADLLVAAATARAAVSAVSATQVAELALEAVRDQRLWVLTHPGRAPAVLERAEQITNSTNPPAAYLA